MPLYTSVPADFKGLHKQTRVTKVSDDDLKQYFEPCKPGILLRIFRLFCFLFFLGPIRLVFTLLFLFVYYLTVATFGSLSHYFNDNKRHFKDVAGRITRIPVRIVLFCLGIIHISVKGKIDDDTRTVVLNHLTMVDPVSILSQAPVSYLVMAGLKGISFFTQTSRVFDIIFVDRSKREGITQRIQRLQKDSSYLPIAIFPEGKVTNGDCLLGFRTGAFINNTPVQPITLRYKMWLCPQGMATISWNEQNPLMYIYQLFSIPFLTLEIDILDKLDWKNSSKTPQERAYETELIMANHLGVLALANTNKSIFLEEEDKNKIK